MGYQTEPFWFFISVPVVTSRRWGFPPRFLRGTASSLRGRVPPSAWRWRCCLWPRRTMSVSYPAVREGLLVHVGAHRAHRVSLFARLKEFRRLAPLSSSVLLHPPSVRSVFRSNISLIYARVKKPNKDRWTEEQRHIQWAGFVIKALIYLPAAGIKDIPASAPNSSPVATSITTENSGGKSQAFLSFLLNSFTQCDVCLLVLVCKNLVKMKG